MSTHLDDKNFLEQLYNESKEYIHDAHLKDVERFRFASGIIDLYEKTHYCKEIPDYGDIFSLEEFKDIVNYDGSAYPIKGDKMMRYDITHLAQIPDDAEKIIFFGK